MTKHTVSGTDMPTLEFPDDFSYTMYTQHVAALNARWVQKLKTYRDPITTPVFPMVLERERNQNATD